MDSKTPARKPVRTHDQATAMVGEIGRVQAQIQRLRAAAEVQVAALKLGLATELEPLQADAERMTELVRGYCEANRAALLKGKGKTIKLPTGDAGWRKGAARLSVGEGVDLLALLKAGGRKLKPYIRVKEEADVASLLKAPTVVEGLTGVAIEPGEDGFFVKPSVLALADSSAA